MSSSAEVFIDPMLDFEVSFDWYVLMEVSYLGFIVLTKFRSLELILLTQTEV
jgi:hypothetical protein